MKICPACKFENPDPELKCIRCEVDLPLTQEQKQIFEIEKEKFTDYQSQDFREKMVNSWKESMEHRLDWLWEIGKQIQMWEQRTGILTLLILAIGVLFLTAWILTSLQGL